MNHMEKCQKWWEKLKNGKGGDIECFIKNESGKFAFVDAFGSQELSCFYFCLKKDGKQTAEIILRENEDCASGSSEKIFIKGKSKVIYIDKDGEGHGFGYNEADKNQSFVLYIRIGSGVKLMWANSASHRVYCAVESNPDNPSDSDCLIEFMQKSNRKEVAINMDREE